MSAPLRVLVLTADLAPGAWSGIGAAVTARNRALAGAGVEVHVVAPAAHPALAGAGGHGVHHHPLRGDRLGFDPSFADVVHLHSLALAELALEIRRRFGLPLVYTAHSQLRHELGPVQAAAPWVRLQERVMQVADHVVVPSRSEAAVAHLPGGRLTVVPHGIAAVPGAPAAPVERHVVFAGRFTRSKGVDVATGAARRLAGGGYTFTFAGGHGDAAGTDRVARLVAAHPGAVHVPGWLPPAAMRCLYRSAAAVVVPSRYEPFGMVALEAMAAGAPVLAAPVGGLADIVGPGGDLVPGHDPDVWAGAVATLLADLARLDRMRRLGPDDVAARFDPYRLACRLRDRVYRPLVGAYREAAGAA